MTGARSIAAAQTVPIRGDVDANIDHHIELGHAAADRRPDGIHYVITVYEPDAERWEAGFRTRKERP